MPDDSSALPRTVTAAALGPRLGEANRVLVLRTFASSLREGALIVDRPIEQPGPGQVLIRQRWAGVNGLFDGVVARGELPYLTAVPPFDMGVEAVGVVVAAGSGVESLAVGDTVATSVFGGGYRHWLTIDADRVDPVPEATPTYVALRTSAVSALLALEQAGRMGSGQTVVITAAAGGLGQFLVQLAALAGNTVVGVCGGPEKAALLRELGCHRAVDRRSEDLGAVLDVEFGGQIDLAVDTVGGALFDVLVRRLAQHGRLVIAGHASDQGPGLPEVVPEQRIYTHLYWKSASVIGFQNSHYPQAHPPALRRLLRLYAQGRLTVAIDPSTFAGLESVPDAVEHLASGKSRGKVVVDLRVEAGRPRP